jgi:hypothetical protein
VKQIIIVALTTENVRKAGVKIAGEWGRLVGPDLKILRLVLDYLNEKGGETEVLLTIAGLWGEREPVDENFRVEFEKNLLIFSSDKFYSLSTMNKFILFAITIPLSLAHTQGGDVNNLADSLVPKLLEFECKKFPQFLWIPVVIYASFPRELTKTLKSCIDILGPLVKGPNVLRYSRLDKEDYPQSTYFFGCKNVRLKLVEICKGVVFDFFENCQTTLKTSELEMCLLALALSSLVACGETVDPSVTSVVERVAVPGSGQVKMFAEAALNEMKRVV